MTASPSFGLPPRFEQATFENYEPRSDGQAEALRATRAFVERQHHSTSLFPSWAARVWAFITGPETTPPTGLYLVGPPGTGKTHLLAAAYNALTPRVSCAFLHSSTLFSQTDPPAAVAHRLADRFAVCCLDEVEIDDPANEMRLVGTMNTLADRGVPLLATSNITPGTHLSQAFSGNRFQQFLRRSFQDQYRVVSVTGTDYRQAQHAAAAEQAPGRGWIGPPAPTRRAMKQVRASMSGPLRWWTFDDLRTATTETAHAALLHDLTRLDHLFVEGISIADADDAFRLLRVIDALYLHAEAPTLYFTAPAPPARWFHPDDHAGVARTVAEKFDRTVSRLHALCEIRSLSSESA
ncbi:MAG: AFG1/ZapE family ATPase [Salinibacter sp.]